MKRIILSVFAAAVTAAWAVPASAGDVTFSGQYRVRGEFTQSNDYNDATTPDSDDFWTQRVRLTANAKATDDVSAKITIQDTRVFGSGLITGVDGLDTTYFDTDSNRGANGFAVHEAYLNANNIFGTPVNFRVGRQELVYGDERLVGAFGWGNHGRAFDAFKFTYNTDAVSIDAFTATTDEAMTFSVDTTSGAVSVPNRPFSNDDHTFSGVYATLKQLIPNNTLDVYLFHSFDGDQMTRFTAGARLKGSAAGVDYTVELPYQFGDQDVATSIGAWAFAAKAGYTLPTPMNVRVGAEYDNGSGDDNALDDKAEAFANLYPTNHMHFGIGDVINSWTNTMAWSVNASADLNEKTKLSVAYWDYTKNEVAAGAPDDLGSEIDAIVTHKYNNAVTVEAGLAHFSPGDATSGVGNPNDPREWAYLQITGNF